MTMYRRCLLSLFASTTVVVFYCEGFPVVPRKSGSRTKTRLSMMGPPAEDDSRERGRGSLDIEKERSRLEALVQTSDPQETLSFLSLPMEQWKRVVEQQPPPPLTAIGRERLLTEISLLQSLSYSDKAVQGLWDLWQNWGGPSASKQLFEAEALVLLGGDDVEADRLQEAETILRNLITQQGSHITWVEPLYRLAYLWYLQERYDESKILCEIILNIKPWHFGARSTIVLVLKAMLHVNEMWDYSSEAMPALQIKDSDGGSVPRVRNQSRTREEWVQEMVQIAESNLLERQEQFTKQVFQKAILLEQQQQQQQQQQQGFYNDTQIDQNAWQ